MGVVKSNSMSNVKKKKMSKSRVLFILGCTLLPVIQWLVFYVYVNFSSITMAFVDPDGELSLYNFIRLFKELGNETSSLRIAIRNTALTFGIQLVTFPFSVLVSYFIYKKIPGYRFFRITFFLPMVLFSVCTTMFFTRIVGANSFIAQAIGEWLNLETPPELLGDSRFANITVLIHMMWLSFPGDLVIWSGTFARIPEDTLEAGRVDGTTWWTEFTRIIVPMVWPTVALKMVLLFCGFFGASGSVFLLTGGEFDTMTLSTWQYIQLLENSGSYYISHELNYLSAVGLLLTVLSLIISLTVRGITDKFFQDVEY